MPIFAPVFFIGLIHLLGGIGILIEPTVVMTTGLAGLHDSPPEVTAVVFIVVGAMAIYSRLTSSTPNLLLVVPQQLVLMAQLWGVFHSMWMGQYPDGTEPIPDSEFGDAVFIFSDQLPIVILALSHTVELFVSPYLLKLNERYRHLYEEESVLRKQAEKALGFAKELKFWTEFKIDD